MKKHRQYRSNQGRRPEQTESNYKITIMAVTGLLLTLIITAICGALGLEL